MKKWFAALLVLLLCLNCAPVVAVESSRDLSFETKLATQLQSLNLFLGVGKNKDGSTNFDLNRQPTRTEAVVMLLRALGKDSEAEKTPKSHPFKDVPKWADGYISYAYAEGLSKGISETKFGANELANSDMYLTFMLRALGYTEGTITRGGEPLSDFSWNAPEGLASYCGILPLQVDTKTFLRADVVNVTTAALYANEKGTNTTLQARLAAQNVFTAQRFQDVFPSDPFADFRTLDQAVTKAIGTIAPLGLFKDNVYGTENHRILELVEKDGTLTMTVLVCYVASSLGTSSMNDPALSSGIALWQIVLDAKTLAVQKCTTAGDLSLAGIAYKDVFSQESMDIRQAVDSDMYAVCGMQQDSALKKGEISYKAPSYDSALAKAKASLIEVRQTMETKLCTVVFGSSKEGETLFLIYPPSETLNEAKTVTYSGMPGGNLQLSKDGLTLYYTYYFENGNLPHQDKAYLPKTKADTLPSSGTVYYFIDLKTGDSSRQFSTGKSVLGDQNSAYETAIAQFMNGESYYTVRALETPTCTVLLSMYTGLPHGASSSLQLVYKANSPLGEGVVIELPVPDNSFNVHSTVWHTSKSEPPKELRLSEDGVTLTYDYHFDDPSYSVGEEGYRAAGTYSYSVDLPTGKVTESFLPK